MVVGLVEYPGIRMFLLRQTNEPKWICYILYILILDNLYDFHGSSDRCNLVFTENCEKTPSNGLQVYQLSSRKVSNIFIFLQYLSIASQCQRYFLHGFQLRCDELISSLAKQQVHNRKTSFWQFLSRFIPFRT